MFLESTPPKAAVPTAVARMERDLMGPAPMAIVRTAIVPMAIVLMEAALMAIDRMEEGLMA